ncbi:MAG: DUF3883 domain-containing protein [Proteobacteria bacterium]|nr:DUF3883 domain-containing protein [Pseudomonadota bacterium]
MSLVEPAILEAARRWIKELRFGSKSEAEASFFSHHVMSDLTPSQYFAALTWLRDVGLFDGVGLTADATDEVLLERALVHGRPKWLLTGDDLWLEKADEMPLDVERLRLVLGLTDRECAAAVRSAFGKVNTAAREEVGRLGEEAVVKLLRGGRDVRVEHVSLATDGLGYDVIVSRADLRLKLEIKSTRRRSRFEFYLSRNELLAAKEDSSWRLVGALLSSSNNLDLLVTVDRGWLVQATPDWNGLSSRWETARYRPPPSALALGIPDLKSFCAFPSLEILLPDDLQGLMSAPSWAPVPAFEKAT